MGKVIRFILTILFPYPIIRTIDCFVCHCEHPKGAWQSHKKRQDCFVSLAMTFLIAGFCLSFSIVVWNAHASDNIKVLIVNDTYPKIPAKNEKIEKLGSMRGDLLVMGSRYTGNIDVWKGEGGIYLINELPIEDYVKDVVVAEVGSNWDMEALKAQAVISRTYAVYQKKINGDSIYHIVSSVLNQVYKGNNPNVRVAYAVAETSGEILTFDNRAIEAFYHSTCGGKTENPEDVFGKSYPYLKSVESNCEISPYSTWEKRIEITEIEKALNLSGIKEISIKSYTSTKRVKQLDIINNSGIITINATDLRKALGWSRLPSTNFSVTRDGDSMIFKGKGYGHGVGLCQWGALQMAREGKNYKEILSFFYPGTIIQLYESR
ncbi:MAG: cell division protein [Nitrospirae bacterium CG_4_10_14_0_8_um_filter_41_23]|nr:SpoIID/LytB domain-containing protein [Nitrospirota bacterium]PIQ94334.1 MAG: cell division protein [Nitrospirae bacterium CG11_big_fil_rev_8_21_14_0_20_41_14]PIV44161.1 MAG: cell division protein [Nitrospirae bacterium CG02_land_8_20_14_3_00_41_53]PIW87288.1 MAG: cell division protein [Nitrospirae bacterium CG_4_8_14_3_um_filter_41_47]PIY86819.1 MAG: cell division protein [Nitrospirae bacterium CG_4_10_14_0_8_um_filter_41_23]PJA79418.1 MAG: cell division protein [Nitrospirae bacterium CG_4